MIAGRENKRARASGHLMRYFLTALLLVKLLCLPLLAGVTTYPDPPNAVTSPVFSLTVDGTAVKVMKYMDYHYAHFAFDGTVSVSVRVFPSITSYKISPASLGLQGQVSGGRNLTFSVDQSRGTDVTPRYLVLQINALEKLVLLGDPPEANVPAPTGPGIFNVVTDHGADATGAAYTQPAIQDAVNAASAYGTPSRPGIVYVPPGLYKVRADLLLKDNVDLYLAPGSVLKADTNIDNYTLNGSTLGPVLTVDNARNVTIRGRGEVDASGITLMNLLSQTAPVFVSQSPEHPRRRIIRTNNGGTSRNVAIHGVLCKDATGWSVELKRTLGVQAQNVKVLNHKNINWKIENDGINVCSSSDAVVNQCFVMTIDDANCSKATDAVAGTMDNVRFSNNVNWTWSAGAKAGMQNDHPMNGVVFRNIDVIHCRRGIAIDTKTSRDMGQTIPIEGVLFDQIRVEEIEANWAISSYDAVEFFLQDGGSGNITIRNFNCPKNRPLRCGPNFSASNVRFENFIMNSAAITKASQVTLSGSRSINNLVFESIPPGVKLGGPATHSAAGFKVTAAFTEPVTGLEAGDFAVTNGAVSSLSGGPLVYTVVVTPASAGWVSVQLPANAVRNTASLDNAASNILTIPRAASAISLPAVTSGSLYLHLSANDLGAADGAAVTSWADSANGRVLGGTATFAANYANGHAGVRFNGTSDVLGSTSFTEAPDVARASLFIVGGFSEAGNDAAADFMVSGHHPGGSGSNRMQIWKSGQVGRVDAQVGSGASIHGVAADAGAHVFGLISGQSAGEVRFMMDGKVLNSGTSGTTEALKGLFLGANGSVPDQFFKGTIAEVLLFEGGLSPADCAMVQDYLTRKYFGHTLDADVDGLPDWWEEARFGNLAASSGGADNADGDAFTDEEEWLAGTDPTDGSSFFRATMEDVTPESIGVSFQGIQERTYTLETSADLRQWMDSDSMRSLKSSGLQTFLFEIAAHEGARFFRVRVSLE